MCVQDVIPGSVLTLTKQRRECLCIWPVSVWVEGTEQEVEVPWVCLYHRSMALPLPLFPGMLSDSLSLSLSISLSLSLSLCERAQRAVWRVNAEMTC